MRKPFAGRREVLSFCPPEQARTAQRQQRWQQCQAHEGDRGPGGRRACGYDCVRAETRRCDECHGYRDAEAAYRNGHARAAGGLGVTVA
nr:hypothetical protein [Micromonospora sp. DSM 115978]